MFFFLFIIFFLYLCSEIHTFLSVTLSVQKLFFWIAVYMLLFCMEEIDQTVQLESVTSVSTAQDQL